MQKYEILQMLSAQYYHNLWITPAEFGVFMPERLFLGGEHGVPGGEHDGLLVEHGADVGGDVFLL